MVVVIATEATIFLVLLASYFFLRASAKEWPIGGLEKPKLELSTIFSFVLWGSSIPIFWAEAAIRRGNQRRFRAGPLPSFLMGAGLLRHTILALPALHFGREKKAHRSLFFGI